MVYFDNNFIFNAKMNLALEEVLYDLLPEHQDFLLLWQNANAVIIGRNQITQNEINQDFIDRNNIEVVRRTSGGGAVYHDLGNLNFSIISNTDFNYSDIIINALKNINKKIQKSGRNDFTLSGFKISGLSQKNSKNKNLLHGTILINSNIQILEKALSPNKLKLDSKGIKSVRARVKNLNELNDFTLTINQVKDQILNEFSKNMEMTRFKINAEILHKAYKLKQEKYTKLTWNYQKNIRNHSKFLRFRNGIVSVSYELVQGKIKDVQITGDFFSNNEVEYLQNYLEDVELLNLKEKINKLKIEEYIVGLSNEMFLQLF